MFVRVARSSQRHAINQCATCNTEQILKNMYGSAHLYPVATAAVFRQPRLPTRQPDGPTTPLEDRIKKSTEEWVKSKALREQRRRELEAEQCTFRPSLSGGGGGSRRSSSVDPRVRARASRPSPMAPPLWSSSRRESGVGSAAATAFAAREAAFQESKEQRLEALRKEMEKLELQEATFRPVIGAEGRRASGGAGVGGGISNGGSWRAPDAVGGAPSGASQTKQVPARAALERKDSVGFKVSPATPWRAHSSSILVGLSTGAFGWFSLVMPVFVVARPYRVGFFC